MERWSLLMSSQGRPHNALVRATVGVVSICSRKGVLPSPPPFQCSPALRESLSCAWPSVQVIANRERVRQAMQRSLVPLTEYLSTYDDLKDLVTLNKHTYTAEYEAADNTNEDMKTEINRHLRRKKQVRPPNQRQTYY